MLCVITDDAKHDWKLYDAIWKNYYRQDCKSQKLLPLYRTLLPFDVECTENQQRALANWKNSLRKGDSTQAKINRLYREPTKLILNQKTYNPLHPLNLQERTQKQSMIQLKNNEMKHTEKIALSLLRYILGTIGLKNKT